VRARPSSKALDVRAIQRELGVPVDKLGKLTQDRGCAGRLRPSAAKARNKD
jgi:hypothetical protein